MAAKTTAVAHIVGDHRDICARAYEIWDLEGRPHGRDLAHWLQAESELSTADKPAPRRKPRVKAAATA